MKGLLHSPLGASLVVVLLIAVIQLAAPLTLDGAQRGGGGQTAAPVQLDALRLPAGFAIAVYAEDVPGARSMTRAPDGTVFVGTRSDSVYAVTDADGDHVAEKIATIATDLNTPNGVAFKDGSLYVAELSRVVRFDNVLASLTAGDPLSEPTVINDQFPSDRPHGWKYLSFGPDGLLYLQVGAPCNICDRPDPYASILRMKPDGTELEVFARGVRNSVGHTWHPDTGDLWFTDNGRDRLGNEQPNDELNRAPRAGLHFGFPYCHQGDILDPEFGEGKSCADYAPPAQKLGPHVAALGLTFYAGSMFPPEYRKQLFIVNHGSWNRSADVDHTGYRIMVAKLDDDRVVGYEPLVTGWLAGRQAWGRPVDLLELPDGSMLVSDDRANVIYRITYSR